MQGKKKESSCFWADSNWNDILFESVTFNCASWATISWKCKDSTKHNPMVLVQRTEHLAGKSRYLFLSPNSYHSSGKLLHFVLQSLHLLEGDNNTELLCIVLWELVMKENTWAWFHYISVQSFWQLRIYFQCLGHISCLSYFYGLGIVLSKQKFQTAGEAEHGSTLKCH